MKRNIPIAVVCLLLLKNAYCQCGNGWVHHGNTCYHVSHDKEEWTGADYVCRRLGGYLAEVNDSTEGHFLENLLKLFQSPEGQTWLGANDFLVEGDWIWANSNIPLSSTVYTNWKPGEPSNNDNNENCLSIYNDGNWNDEHCYVQLHYICEKGFDSGSSEIVG